jgi:putative transposase
MPIIGISPLRMEEFECRLIQVLSTEGSSLHAWCVLPNHWHALIDTVDLKDIISIIGKMHGATSYQWNAIDEVRGRKCWHRCSDRRIRSERHFYVARNYIHHNPVNHGYVEKWEEWPFSSASGYISNVGREAVIDEWIKYPILDMGKGWDED